MHITLVLALCLATLGLAAPSPSTHTETKSEGRRLVTFVMSEPDCPTIKDYCTHCNGNFYCETDPRCEWCWEHGGFNSTAA